DRLLAPAVFRFELFGAEVSDRLARSFVRAAGAPRLEVSTFTSKYELAALLRLSMQVPPGVAGLEIGSYLGASARYLIAGLSRHGSMLYCVDTWNNETMPDGIRDTLAEFKRNVGPLLRWAHLVRKNSAELTRADVQAPIGLVFIDGDHSYEMARRDFDVI